MDTLIVWCAKYLIALSVVIALYALYRVPPRERMRRTLIVLASLALTYGLGKLASHFYFDPRPFAVTGQTPLIAHAADNGFPSDHTLLAAGLAAAALYFNRRVALWLWIIAIIIGGARILALVHHPIDILGSILCALVATGIVEWIAKKFFF